MRHVNRHNSECVEPPFPTLLRSFNQKIRWKEKSMLNSNFHQYFSEVPSSQVEIGELKMIEDKIPYLCEVDTPKKASCVFAQSNTDITQYNAYGLNRNLSRYKIPESVEVDHPSSYDRLNHWNYPGNYSLVENHQLEESSAPSSLLQRSSQNQTAPVRSSFTVHHRGQSNIGQYEDNLSEDVSMLNHYQEVPGIYHATLFVLKPGRCH